MAEIKPFEIDEGSDGYDWRRPYAVTVDGEFLRSQDGRRIRMFKTDVAAVAAGMDHVTRTRRAPSEGDGHG